MVPPLEKTRKILEKLSPKHEEVIEQEGQGRQNTGAPPCGGGPDGSSGFPETRASWA